MSTWTRRDSAIRMDGQDWRYACWLWFCPSLTLCSQALADGFYTLQRAGCAHYVEVWVQDTGGLV